ncbi:MAG: helix-turn-helix transcriptional regulator [Candidatus Diapherotrites archaeon]|nr:helix-turn-helix transcriptional regulator [Candidatus Diapherotrites archaeon]
MSTWIIENRKNETFSLPAKELDPQNARKALSPVAWQIVSTIAKKPMYPAEIAKHMKIHEQKVYYHIHNLEKSGIIKVIKHENMNGVIAKFYGLEAPAFILTLKEMEKTHTIPTTTNDFFYPFIQNGKLESTIVIGSPESHGPEKTRARDAPSAINFGLLLGCFLNYTPPLSVKFDTDLKENDLKQNLIIIGGPGVNKTFEKINGSLPIRFVKKNESNFYTKIHSVLSGKEYLSEDIGIFIKTTNPFDETKSILVIAGMRNRGTASVIFALMNNFEDMCKGNKFDSKVFAKVIEGIDADSDNKIDSIEIKE